MEKRLTLKQRRAVIAIISSDSIMQACQNAGVAERTIRRWVKLPEFKAELVRIEQNLLESTTGKLAGLQERAINALSDCLTSKNENAKLRACQLVLDYSIRYREINRFESRIEELEKEVFKDEAKY